MCRQTARASPAAPSPVRLPTFSEDFSNEDKVDILLSVNDTINGKIGEKISALLDEQEATAAAAGSTASGAGSSQDHAGMAPPTQPSTPSRPKFTPDVLSPNLDPTVGGSGGRSSHSIVFDASPKKL